MSTSSMRAWLLSLLILSSTVSLAEEPCLRGFIGVEQLLAWRSLNPMHRIADVNTDGRPDLVVLSSGVYVLLNRGNGVFEPRKVAAGPLSEPQAMHVGDATGDGVLDIVFVKNNTIVLLPGLGGEAFGAPVNGTMGEWFNSNYFADLDGDGAVDIVQRSDGKLTFLTASPSGVWRIVGTLLISWNGFTDVLLGDYDGDGRIDIAAFNGSSPSASSINFLWNEGGFAFDPRYELLSPLDMYAMADDLDGDGVTEIIGVKDMRLAIIRAPGRAEPSVEWLAYEGSLDSHREGRTYSTGLNRRIGTLALSKAADLDGDGRRDVLFSSTGGLVVFWGGSEGGAEPYPTSAFSVSGTVTGVADIDGDGIDDLLLTSQPWLSMIRGRRGNRQLVAGSLNPVPIYAGPIIARDLDHDGFVDLVVSSGGGENPLETAKALIYRNDGKGAFRRSSNTGFPRRVAAVEDLDGDGNEDLVFDQLENPRTIEVRFGDGSAGFGAAKVLPPFGKYVGVVRENGRNIIVTSSEAGSGCPESCQTAVAHRIAFTSERDVVITPLLKFGVVVGLPARSQINVVHAVDLEDDGDVDLQWGERFLIQESTGWRWMNPPVPQGGILAADVNDDGLGDFVLWGDFSIELRIAQGDRTYSVVTVPQTAARSSLANVTTSDVDGNGLFDLIYTWVDAWLYPMGVGVMLAEGGRFRPHTLATDGPTSTGNIVMLDVDGDGRQDAVVGTHSGIAVLRNGCVPSAVRIAADRTAIVEGESLTLFVQAAHVQYDTYWSTARLFDGGAFLSDIELKDPFATASITVKGLAPGRHTLIVEYPKEGRTAATATIEVRVAKAQSRRRSARH